MSIAQMCLQGSVMIVAVLVARALLLKRLPKVTFLVLWAIVLVRLLVPFALPAPWSLWTATDQALGALGVELSAGQRALLRDDATAESLAQSQVFGSVGQAEQVAVATSAGVPTSLLQGVPAADGSPAVADAGLEAAPSAVEAPGGPDAFEGFAVFAGLADLSLWQVVWLAGIVAAAVIFAVLYLRGVRDFSCSLPVDHPYARQWFATHRLRRSLTIRELDTIDSPFTYGVLRPVIVVPSTLDWNNRAAAALSLEHEFTHIRRFDAVTKVLLGAALCLYWYNPLVWAMYIMANRDIELSCDEVVLRKMGKRERVVYANTLVALAERKAGLVPLLSGFGKNAIEERVVSIAGMRPVSVVAALAACALVAGFAVFLGTTSVYANGGSASSDVSSNASAGSGVQVAQASSDYPSYGRLPMPGAGVRVVEMEGAVVLATPYYAVTLPRDLLGADFTWSFDESTQRRHYLDSDVALAHFLTVNLNDGPCAGQSFTVYCTDAPRIEAAILGEEYVEWVAGTCAVDESLHVMVAIETASASELPYVATYADNPAYQSLYAARFWETFISTESTYAVSTREEGGVRITLPECSVLVPNDLLSDGWTWRANSFSLTKNAIPFNAASFESGSYLDLYASYEDRLVGRTVASVVWGTEQYIASLGMQGLSLCAVGTYGVNDPHTFVACADGIFAGRSALEGWTQEQKQALVDTLAVGVTVNPVLTAQAAEAQASAVQAAVNATVASDETQHVASPFYAFDVPAYWQGRVEVATNESTGSTVVYPVGNPAYPLLTVEVVDSATPYEPGGGASVLLTSYENGHGQRIEVWARNYVYLTCQNAWFEGKGDVPYCGVEAEATLVDLSTGGAFTAGAAVALWEVPSAWRAFYDAAVLPTFQIASF